MLIHSAVITGSVQFNNTDVSGITNVSSFATTASVDAVVVKTGSYASTSSVNELQSKTGSYATTSSVNELQSKTGSYTSTSSFDAYSSSINTFTSSATTRLNTIESVTGSYASTSSVNNLQSVTGSYASTGSNQFNGNQSISGSITSNGTITAQTLVVQTVTSSIEFVTGSTRNGSLSSNTHQFTGSVLVSGSVGIGTSSPLGKLDINTGGNTNIVISNDSTDTGYNIVSLNGTRTKGSYAGIAGGGTADNNLYLNCGSNVIIQTGASFAERMRITSGGVVTIGKTDQSGNAVLTVKSPAGGNTGVILIEGDTTNDGWGMYATTADEYRITRFTNGSYSDKVIINSTGVVTKPYQPAFKAGRSTNYSAGANTNVIFNDTSSVSNHFNVGGHYNASNGLFTAPVDGIYVFSTVVIYMSMSAGQAMDDAFYIYRNSTLVSYSFRRSEYEVGYTGNGGYYVDHANTLLNLVAGDTVSIRNNRAADIHGNTNYCFFYGYMLG
jgi:hypothetical protein